MKKLLLGLALALHAALASAQSLPKYAMPYSGGPGTSGWIAVGPCAAGFVPMWLSGPTSPPTCQSVAGAAVIVAGTPPITASLAGSTWTVALTTPLAVNYGGTGLAAGTSGGIPCYTGSTTIASSAALTVNRLLLGGGAGACPSVLGAGTSTTLLHGGTPPTFGAVVLTTDVSGILPVPNGGTGLATVTAGNILAGNGTSAFQTISPSTATYVLTSNGVGVLPTFQVAAPSAGSVDFPQLVARVGQIPGTRNYFMGGAGNSGVIGLDNIGFGGGVLAALTTGTENNCFGGFSSAANAVTCAAITTTKNNALFGSGVGVALTTQAAGSLGFNSGFGYGALMWLRSGTVTPSQENSGFGVNACNGMTTGVGNTCIGGNAGQGYYLPSPLTGTPSTGDYNVFIGYNTASWWTNLSLSVVIGTNAGNSFTIGGTNVIVGANNLTGDYDPTTGTGTAQTGTRIVSVGYGNTGLKTGSYDILVGSEITGCLAAAANITVIGSRVACAGVGSNEIFIADGSGNVRIKSTSAGVLTFGGYSSAGIAHISAAGLLSSSAVDLASATEVTGNLGVTHLNSGSGASASTVWCGNGTWCTPTASGISTKVTVFTRDLTAASGNVAYTGVGFVPTTIRLQCSLGIASGMSIGFSDSAKNVGSTFLYSTAQWATSTSYVTRIDADTTTSNYQSAVIASYDADGFTLTWTKTASPTGTATCVVLSSR